MQETTRLICITCPMGCAMDVTHDGDTIIRVQGHGCKKGLEHARAELVDPRRVVTTTVRVRGGLHPLLPVYSAAPIPKPLVFDLLETIGQIEVRAPVQAGQVVLADALGTGVDILASRHMPAA